MFLKKTTHLFFRNRRLAANPVDAAVGISERRNLNDLLRQAVTINGCRFGTVDYSVERPFATDNDESRSQKEKRVKAFRKLEKILGIHNSLKSEKEILDKKIIVHPAGVSQMYNGMGDDRVVYKPSEQSNLDWHCTRENYHKGCAAFIFVLKPG